MPPMPWTVLRASALLAAAACVVAAALGAEELYSATITIRGHRFEPAELHVPAGKRILLTIVNADPLSEEFDSTALKVEKVVAGNAQGTVHIGPLQPGHYDFIGEYHEETAKGQVIAE
jgi:plastocyanin